MLIHQKEDDEQLSRLPLPMRSIGIENDVNTEHLPRASDKVFGERQIRADRRDYSRTQFSVLEVGGICCAVGRTSPLIYTQESRERATIFICHSGVPRYAEAKVLFPLAKGMMLVNPNNGGSFATHYSSGIYFQITRQSLARTIKAMSGVTLPSVLETPDVFSGKEQRFARVISHLFSYIDTLVSEERSLPVAMGLDEQVYRTIGGLILEQSVNQTKLARQHSILSCGTNGFDDLVDYIRDNIHSSLTLTNLQEQSHYSTRHLQNLFREKFECTPMQFVRRQRLEKAMEKLQTASLDDTVTSIARDCGYRFTSNFSNDFKREFGVAPSVVLRASRGKEV